MDFARKHMQSLGWKEGNGLGKRGDGIVRSLRPALKFDKNGVGFRCDHQLDNQWWNEAFNCASHGVDVRLKQTNAGIKLATSGDQTDDRSLRYSNFVKSDTDSSLKRTSEELEEKGLDMDRVFKKSKGRTCHPSTRLGIKRSAKLERIAKQETLYCALNKNKAQSKS